MTATITDINLGLQGPSGPLGLPVRLATIAALPSYLVVSTGLQGVANGALSIDGVAVVEGDDVLVQAEGGGTHLLNRVYTVIAPGDSVTPYRLGYKAGIAYKTGLAVSIGRGGTLARTIRILTTDGTITVGTTPMTWESLL